MLRGWHLNPGSGIRFPMALAWFMMNCKLQQGLILQMSIY
ncbi:Uncharacterised protein [Raoultella terrigena]|uniref:Uncharacterized protein n=1 Tax=Raoultella terrigena TaxID=577 RepID=A0A4U9CUM0_RAOTE|nr:Uncharacterised protein [Raoultella terrigena]